MPGSYLVRREGGGGAFAAVRLHLSRQEAGCSHMPRVGSQAGVRAWIAGAKSQPGGCR